MVAAAECPSPPEAALEVHSRVTLPTQAVACKRGVLVLVGDYVPCLLMHLLTRSRACTSHICQKYAGVIMLVASTGQLLVVRYWTVDVRSLCRILSR